LIDGQIAASGIVIAFFLVLTAFIWGTIVHLFRLANATTKGPLNIPTPNIDLKP
jgi:hypothetical protein